MKLPAHIHCTAPCPCRRSLAGFSLVELLVAMVLSIMLLGMVLQIFMNSRQSYQVQSLWGHIQDNGRHALQVLNQELRLAGFAGPIYEFWNFSNDTARPIPAAGSISGECFTTGYRWVAPMLTTVDPVAPRVSGSDGTRSPFNGCISSADYVSGTDVVSVHYIGPDSVAAADLQAGTLYARVDVDNGVLFECTGAGGVACDPNAPAGEAWDAATEERFALGAAAFFVRPCSDDGGDGSCDASDDGIPALVRARLQPDGSVDTDVVAEGVESMQIRYGIDTTGDGFADQYVDASAIGNPSSSAASWSTWRTVRTVRVWLLIRGDAPEAGYTDTRTYNMGNQSYTPSGNAAKYRRQLYSTTVALRNYF